MRQSRDTGILSVSWCDSKSLGFTILRVSTYVTEDPPSASPKCQEDTDARPPKCPNSASSTQAGNCFLHLRWNNTENIARISHRHPVPGAATDSCGTRWISLRLSSRAMVTCSATTFPKFWRGRPRCGPTRTCKHAHPKAVFFGGTTRRNEFKCAEAVEVLIVLFRDQCVRVGSFVLLIGRRRCWFWRIWLVTLGRLSLVLPLGFGFLNPECLPHKILPVGYYQLREKILFWESLKKIHSSLENDSRFLRVNTGAAINSSTTNKSTTNQPKKRPLIGR